MKKTKTIGAALILSLSILPGVTFTAKAQTPDSTSNKVTVQTNSASNLPASGTASSVSSNLGKQQVDVVKDVGSDSTTGASASNPTSPSTQTKIAYDQHQINNREIVVGLKKGVSTPVTVNGATLVSQDGKSIQRGYEIVRVGSSQNYAAVLQKITQMNQVDTASPNYLQHVSYTPSNSQIKQERYLKAIDAYGAWNVTKGSEHSVTVAVLDTGVNSNQTSFKGRLLTGYNFVANSTDTTDDNGHGTAVAGLIAASANSGDLVGVDFNAKILPIKVADSSGELQDSTIIQGIQYAIDHGANVINMSFGGTQYDDALAAELQKAHNAGIVLVAAAGNDGTSTWEFPASNDDVISVGAVDEDNYPASFSNYGDWLDLMAPGTNMAILGKSGGVTQEDGTSFATPLVSGAAALLKSLHPTWSPDLIEWALEKSTLNNPSHSWDPSVGFGDLDIYKAVTLSAPSGPSGWVPSSSTNAVALKSGVAHRRIFVLPNEKDWYSFKVSGPSKVSIKFYGGDPNTDLVGELYQNTSGQLKHLVTIDNEYAGGTETYSFTAKQSGTYNLVISDYFGHFTNKSYSVTVTTQSTPAPAATVNSGTYSHALSVALHAPKGDTIKYTLDGSTPSATHGTTYSKPIAIGKTLTLKAVTIPASGNLLSAVKTYNYTISTPAPVATVNSGTYSQALSVVLNAPKGDTIKYTLDGSTPSATHGTTYSKPIPIGKTLTLKAVTIPASGNILSSVKTYSYTINLPGSPSSSSPSDSTSSPGTTTSPSGSTSPSGPSSSTGTTSPTSPASSPDSSNPSGSNGSTNPSGSSSSTTSGATNATVSKLK